MPSQTYSRLHKQDLQLRRGFVSVCLQQSEASYQRAESKNPTNERGKARKVRNLSSLSSRIHLVREEGEEVRKWHLPSILETVFRQW